MGDEKPAVLIVDDMPMNIRALSVILESDYEVLVATSGTDALEKAAREKPDLILLDVIMPGMDGYAVCAHLKQDAVTKEIPIVFITAMDQEEDETRGLELGAIDYITKPLRPAIVKARVRNHIEFKKSKDILASLSSVDGLTGIANRRRFDDYLEQEWLRAIRTKSPLALVLIDLDFFKPYNDTYGHLAGDDCLGRVAHALAATFKRPADLVARFGGEEFACVLPETDLSGAILVANQLLHGVASLGIPHSRSAVAPCVTISLGTAAILPPAGLTPEELIRWADEQLYLAKKEGRNRVKG